MEELESAAKSSWMDLYLTKERNFACSSIPLDMVRVRHHLIAGSYTVLFQENVGELGAEEERCTDKTLFQGHLARG